METKSPRRLMLAVLLGHYIAGLIIIGISLPYLPEIWHGRSAAVWQQAGWLTGISYLTMEGRYLLASIAMVMMGGIIVKTWAVRCGKDSRRIWVVVTMMGWGLAVVPIAGAIWLASRGLIIVPHVFMTHVPWAVVVANAGMAALIVAPSVVAYLASRRLTGP